MGFLDIFKIKKRPDKGILSSKLSFKSSRELSQQVSGTSHSSCIRDKRPAVSSSRFTVGRQPGKTVTEITVDEVEKKERKKERKKIGPGQEQRGGFLHPGTSRNATGEAPLMSPRAARYQLWRCNHRAGRRGAGGRPGGQGTSGSAMFSSMAAFDAVTAGDVQ